MAGFDIDFGALQQPNILGNFLQGQEIAQRRRQNVLAEQRQGRQDARQGVVDARQDQTWARDDAQQAARTSAFKSYAAGDRAGARQSVIGAGDMEGLQALQTMDKEQLAQAATRADAFGRAGYGLQQIPEPQRRAAIVQMTPDLLAHGLKQEEIDNFDPSNANLAALISQAMTLSEQITAADKEADNKRADAQLGETRRHNVAGEGTARGQLGVAQGRLGVAQAAHRARLAAGGYGTPGVGGVAVRDEDVEVDP